MMEAVRNSETSMYF